MDRNSNEIQDKEVIDCWYNKNYTYEINKIFDTENEKKAIEHIEQSNLSSIINVSNDNSDYHYINMELLGHFNNSYNNAINYTLIEEYYTHALFYPDITHLVIYNYTISSTHYYFMNISLQMYYGRFSEIDDSINDSISLRILDMFKLFIKNIWRKMQLR